jgi:citrate lyase subunit beta / citryl-CoA lyase
MVKRTGSESEMVVFCENQRRLMFHDPRQADDAYFEQAVAGLRMTRIRRRSLFLLNRTTPLRAVTSKLAASKVPVVFVWGDHDYTAHPSMSQRQAECKAAIPHAQLHVLPHAGHLAHREQAAIFNEVVVRFLGSCVPKSALSPLPLTHRRDGYRLGTVFVPTWRNPLKGLLVDADMHALELEDGVPAANKDEARRILSELLRQSHLCYGPTLFMRINGLEVPQWMVKDLEACVYPTLTGLILPKVECVDDVHRYEKFIAEAEARALMTPGHLKLIVVLETCRALVEVLTIIQASERIVGVVLGTEDLKAEMRVTSPFGTDLNFAKSLPLLPALEAGIAIIDGPFMFIDDLVRYEAHCKTAKRLGYTGHLCLTPTQVKVAAEVLRPTAEDELWARNVLARMNESIHRYPSSGRMFVGNPHRMIARNILDSLPPGVEPTSLPTDETVRGRVPSYAIDLLQIRVGDRLPGSADVTIDDGMRAMWVSSALEMNRLFTSVEFARAIGLRSRPVPYAMLMSLCLGLAVEAFSEESLMHVGLQHGVYERAVYIGDTVRSECHVLGMENTPSGTKCIVRTAHVLRNQFGERVFTVIKLTMFPPLPEGTGCLSATAEEEMQVLGGPRPMSMLSTPLGRGLRGADWELVAGAGNCSGPNAVPRIGDLMVHKHVRRIDWSEASMINTMMLNTNRLHWETDTDRNAVGGVHVMAVVKGIASRDFRQTVLEEVIECGHVVALHPCEHVGALTYVLAAEPVPDQPLVVLTLKTLGVKNVNVASDLADVPIPRTLLLPHVLRPSDCEMVCSSACRMLEHRIVVQMLWRIVCIVA